MEHQRVRKVVQGWRKRAQTRKTRKQESPGVVNSGSDASPPNGEDTEDFPTLSPADDVTEPLHVAPDDQNIVRSREKWRRLKNLLQQKSKKDRNYENDDSFPTDARRYTVAELNPTLDPKDVRSNSVVSVDTQELLSRRSNRKSGKDLWRKCVKSLKKKTRRSESKSPSKSRSNSKSPSKSRKSPPNPHRIIQSPNSLHVGTCVTNPQPRPGGTKPRSGSPKTHSTKSCSTSPKSPRADCRLNSVLEKFKNASVMLNRGMCNLKDRFTFDDSQRVCRKIRVEFEQDERREEEEEESVALDNPDHNYTTAMMMTSLKDGRFTASLPLDILPAGDITIRVRNYRMEIIVGRRTGAMDDRHRITKPVKYGDIDIPIYVTPQSLRFHMEAQRLCVTGFTKGCWFTGRRVSFGEPLSPKPPASPTLSRAGSLGSTSGIWA